MLNPRAHELKGEAIFRRRCAVFKQTCLDAISAARVGELANQPGWKTLLARRASILFSIATLFYFNIRDRTSPWGFFQEKPIASATTDMSVALNMIPA